MDENRCSRNEISKMNKENYKGGHSSQQNEIQLKSLEDKATKKFQLKVNNRRQQKMKKLITTRGYR